MKLVVAAGGTGGHVFPGIAIAQALKKVDPYAQILFIGTDHGIEKHAVPKAGFQLQAIRVAGLKGLSFKRKLRTLFDLPRALFVSMGILRRFKPDAVIGIGGYVSGPVLLGAWLLRIPVAVCEPNSVPGFTNWILGKLSRRIFGAFESTRAFFGHKKYALVGNPLRSDFHSLPHRPILSGDTVNILVLGGSMGARALNETVPKAIALLKTDKRIQVLHQTGVSDVEATKARYQNLPILAEVKPFIDNMGEVLSQIDLIICRSGATTCAEICAVGVPSILVPFPYAVYDHQTKNAEELVEAKAAILLPQNELNDQKLSEIILSLINNQSSLSQMAINAKRLGKLDAAERIVDSALNGFK